jgi:hypothetical protein
MTLQKISADFDVNIGEILVEHAGIFLLDRFPPSGKEGSRSCFSPAQSVTPYYPAPPLRRTGAADFSGIMSA